LAVVVILCFRALRGLYISATNAQKQAPDDLVKNTLRFMWDTDWYAGHKYMIQFAGGDLHSDGLIELTLTYHAVSLYIIYRIT
jgi:hypothetical protein